MNEKKSRKLRKIFRPIGRGRATIMGKRGGGISQDIKRLLYQRAKKLLRGRRITPAALRDL